MNTGRNPMRWNCEERGCFNVKRRPKIEEFAECLPRRIAFSDIDGITEVNDHYLLLEWKGHPGELPTGQRIMFERMTSGVDGRFAVLVIAGDPETMDITALARFWAGRFFDFEGARIEDVKERIRRWSAWARGVPYKPPRDEIAAKRNEKEEAFKELLRLEGTYSEVYSDGNDITLTEDEITDMNGRRVS